MVQIITTLFQYIRNVNLTMTQAVTTGHQNITANSGHIG